MIKLNLGCGSTNFGSDWLHGDATNYPHIDFHCITKLPFKNETVDLIYASHVIEYFDQFEVQSVLKEWHRALKFGGVLRLAVPNFETMALAYVYGDCSLSEIIGPLYGRMKSGDNIIYHKYTYDFYALSAVLTKIGFKNVKKYDWKRTPPHNEIDDQSKAYLPHCPECIKKQEWPYDSILISLNVECVK